MLRASAITFSDLSWSAGSDVCEPSHEVNWVYFKRSGLEEDLECLTISRALISQADRNGPFACQGSVVEPSHLPRAVEPENEPGKLDGTRPRLAVITSSDGPSQGPKTTPRPELMTAVLQPGECLLHRQQSVN